MYSRQDKYTQDKWTHTHTHTPPLNMFKSIHNAVDFTLQRYHKHDHMKFIIQDKMDTANKLGPVFNNQIIPGMDAKKLGLSQVDREGRHLQL